MGKKCKKINKMQGNELQSNNVVKLEPEEVNVDSQTDSIKKTKKKNIKRDLNGIVIEDASVQIKSEEMNESNTQGNIATFKIKKATKNKQNIPNEEELCEVQTDTNTLIKDQLVVPKKKKKKNKLLDEKDKSTIESCVKIEEHKPQKDSNEKKNKEEEKASNIKNETIKQKKKKGKKKAKTGAPILNDEESQVTEEDIDRFIDELDEEDNKQYEDWVKLLDARLRKKQQTE